MNAHAWRRILERLPFRRRSASSAADALPAASAFGAPAGALAPWADDPAEQVRHYRHWVYAAVRAIANRVSGTPLRFLRGDTGESLSFAHPLPRLLREVNPFDTAVTLWQKTLLFLELTGNAYWYAPRNALGAVAELWILPSHRMHVLPDPARFIGGYLYRGGGVEERFSPDEVIHLKYPSPESPYYGRGPLQAAAASVDAHEAMKTAERRSFERGVFPGLAVQTTEKLSGDVRKRLETALARGFAGPDRAGRALILEQGLTVRPFTFSPREMDFLESSRITRDEILAVFGVPAAVAGLSEDVNRASAEAMLHTFAENTIFPKLRLLEAQLTQDLCRAFDPRIEARFDSPLPSVRAEDRADMIARLRNGVTTVNEERRRLGLAPRPGGDNPLLPAAAPSPASGDATETEEGEMGTAEGAEEKVVRAAASALGGQLRRVRARLRDSGLSAYAALEEILADPEEKSRLLGPLAAALPAQTKSLRRDRAAGLADRLFEAVRAETAADAPASADRLAALYHDRVIPLVTRRLPEWLGGAELAPRSLLERSNA